MATLMERGAAVRDVELSIPRFTLSVTTALQRYRPGYKEISWIAHASIIYETLW